MSVVSVVLSKDGKTFGNTAIQQYSVTGLGTVCAKLGPLDGFSSGDHVTMQIVFKSSTESKNLVRTFSLLFRISMLIFKVPMRGSTIGQRHEHTCILHQ